MQIKSINAKNFLSFRELNYELPEGVAYIVGPNNSGKSNLFRLIRYVSLVMSQQKEVNDKGYIQWGSESFDISIEVKLSNQDKQYIIDFLICSTITTFGEQSYSPNKYTDTQRNLIINYIANYGENIFSSLGDRLTIIIQWDKARDISTINIPKIIFKIYFGEKVLTFNSEKQPTIDIAEVIFEELKKRGADGKEPANIVYLLGHDYKAPSLDKLLVQNENNTNLQIGYLKFNIIGRNLGKMQNYISNKLNKIQTLCNVEKEQRDITIVNVIYSIFAKSLVLLSDPRYSIDDVIFESNEKPTSYQDQSPANIESAISKQPRPLEVKPAFLTEFLFNLQNSLDPKEKNTFKKINEEFHKLTEFELDVGINEIDVGINKIDVGINEINNKLSHKKVKKLALRLFDSNNNVMSYETVSSGTLESLLLAVALSQEEKIVLLDEPAQNLHPTKQKEIHDNLITKSANQVIVITHSPYIIDAKSLNNITRFSLVEGSTRLYPVNISPELEKIKNNATLLASLLSCLFAKTVIVGEGVHEVEALRIWLTKENVDMQETQLLYGSGSGNLPTFCKIFKKLGINYYVFSDKKNSDFTKQECGSNAIIYDYDDIAGLLEAQPKFNDVKRECNYEINEENNSKREPKNKTHIHLEDVMCLAEHIDPPKEVKDLIEELRRNNN
ncbi:MAG: AAA family ATPase [Conexivisphaerales archaeon]